MCVRKRLVGRTGGLRWRREQTGSSSKTAIYGEFRSQSVGVATSTNVGIWKVTCGGDGPVLASFPILLRCHAPSDRCRDSFLGDCRGQPVPGDHSTHQ